jgi:hypothetical protein
MSNTDTKSQQAIDFSRLLRAAEGLSQWRPLVAGFVTLVLTVLVAALGGFLASKVDSGAAAAVITLIMGLGAFVVFSAGLSAVGVMLMDRAKFIPVRSIMDAFIFGLICLPKFIGFALLLVLVWLAIALVAAVVYFLCKIPGIGPVMLLVAHPLMVVLWGLVSVAVGWVMIPLMAPAIWEGRSLKEALSIAYAAARERLFTVVATLVMLYLVVALVAGVLASGLLSGYAVMTAIAVGILGPEVASGFAGMGAMMSGFGMNSGGGYMYAGIMASGLIFAVAAALLMQVLIMGVNLVYLSTTDGLDIASGQAALERQLSQMKQKAQEAQVRARQAAERARQAAQQSAQSPVQPQQAAATSPTSTPALTATATCPNCKASVTADDVFCGECGHRLKT